MRVEKSRTHCCSIVSHALRSLTHSAHTHHLGSGCATTSPLSRRLRRTLPAAAAHSPGGCGALSRRLRRTLPAAAAHSPSGCGTLSRRLRRALPAAAARSPGGCGALSQRLRHALPAAAARSTGGCGELSRRRRWTRRGGRSDLLLRD